MFSKLNNFVGRPELYDRGTLNIWEDEHVSKEMLAAHLDPNSDAATRKHAFLDKSVKWISEIAPSYQYKLLLDLGCGPGLYAERFYSMGYSVTGVDFSKRSIDYAKEQSLLNESNIKYLYQNYLKIDYEEKFDLITLIYCDYAPLSKSDRQVLLHLVHRALKTNGKFIFDVFTSKKRRPENRSWYYTQNSDFWCAEPHLCLSSVYQYDDEDHTELQQTLVCTDETISCYNVWDHFFTRESLISEIQPIEFNECEFFGDVAGAEFSDKSETICVVLTK